MEDKICCICGDDLKSEFSHTLECNHSYHYQCILLSFKNMNNNECPTCRSTGNYLPLVNGLKKIYEGIHDTSNLEEFSNHTCNMVLQKGKNKGQKCSKNCILGRDYCKVHYDKIKKTNIKN